jgi:5-methylcytosine-specific restriction enzyme A
MPRRRCLTPGCGTLHTNQSYCDAHRPKAWRTKRTGPSPYGGDSWKIMRRMVLSEEPVCRICHQAPSTQVDHIEPVARGGAWLERSNLQGVCGPCHRRKTARVDSKRPRP